MDELIQNLNEAIALHLEDEREPAFELVLST